MASFARLRRNGHTINHTGNAAPSGSQRLVSELSVPTRTPTTRQATSVAASDAAVVEAPVAVVPAAVAAAAAATGPPTNEEMLSHFSEWVAKQAVRTLVTVGAADADLLCPKLRAWLEEVRVMFPKSHAFLRKGLKADCAPPSVEELDNPLFDESKYFVLEPNPQFDPEAYRSWCDGLVAGIVREVGPLLPRIEQMDESLVHDTSCPIMTELGVKQLYESLDAESQELILKMCAEWARLARMHTMFNSKGSLMPKLLGVAASLTGSAGSTNPMAALRHAGPALKELMSSMTEADHAELESFMSTDGNQPQFMFDMASKFGLGGGAEGGGMLSALMAGMGGGGSGGAADMGSMLGSIMGGLGGAGSGAASGGGAGEMGDVASMMSMLGLGLGK